MARPGDYAAARFRDHGPDAKPSDHVESYFLKANDRLGRRAVWLKTTVVASARHPGAAVAEAWAIAFDRDEGHVAVKEAVPAATAEFDRDALGARVAGCELTPTHARGALETGARRIAWDLRIDSRAPPIMHFPHAWMYDRAFPATKIASPAPDVRVSGTVDVDGARWSIDAWPGLVGHNWGRRHTDLYAWGHVNVWDDEDDFTLEGMTGRARLGPLRSPLATLLCARYRGVRYELNALSDIARNRGEITARRWRFEGASSPISISGELWGNTDDFVGLYYENPRGAPTHCLNTKLACARVELRVRGGAPRILTSRAAALEIGTHDTAHGVRMYV